MGENEQCICDATCKNSRLLWTNVLNESGFEQCFEIQLNTFYSKEYEINDGAHERLVCIISFRELLTEDRIWTAKNCFRIISKKKKNRH